MNVENHVKEVISEKLCINIKKIIPQAEIISDLGADSLDQVELLMALEDEFDLEDTSLPVHYIPGKNSARNQGYQT